MKTENPEIVNPFTVTSPEDLSAEATVDLFVDVFNDFPKIVDPGHIFLVGPRGSGKSMMFRYLMPDCQCISRHRSLKNLPFLGIYVPLKNTNFYLAEFERLNERHASDVLNSHLLAAHIAVEAFKILANSKYYNFDRTSNKEVRRFYSEVFVPRLKVVGYSQNISHLQPSATAADVFIQISNRCEEMYQEGLSFAKRLAFTKELLPYQGALCDYISFLLPLLAGLRELSCMPKGPIYLLIDDAHWLSQEQARVLNSWVATRTSLQVSLKISTQNNYETYYTLAGSPIDTPHDYSEIQISTIYTTKKGTFRDRIWNIVKKRLERAKILDVKPEEFFPPDEEQEGKIRQIEQEYRAKWDRHEGRGAKRSDDAYRYARADFIRGSDPEGQYGRAEFIRDLAGQRKSSSTYSYAGFDQLVHLSSGIVRFFLEPAITMYADASSKNENRPISCIPPGIQDHVARDFADNFLFDDIDRFVDTNDKDHSVQAGNASQFNARIPPKQDLQRLSKLLHGLGAIFRQILLSNRSERRVFSIALSDSMSDDVRRILDLGVQLGYFHRATIGRKDSVSGGRTRLYVLSRRLAPIWNLDPTGFAGYLFVTNRLIQEAMDHPATLWRRLERSGLESELGNDEEMEIVQMELF